MAKPHDEFLYALRKEWFKVRYPAYTFEVNESYDPKSRKPLPKGKRSDSSFQYDIIGYPNKDWSKPEIFVEFSDNENFDKSKFIYEMWRWLFFLVKIGYLRIMPIPSESLTNQDISYPYEDIDIPRGPHGINFEHNWHPKLIQIWKNKTIEKNYKKLKRIGYIPKFLKIECYSVEVEPDLNKIYKKVYP